MSEKDKKNKQMDEMVQDAAWEGMPASFPVCQEHKEQYFKDNEDIKVLSKEYCYICQQVGQ